MRLPLLLILPLLILGILIDWYICRVVRRSCRPVWYKVALWSSVVFALFLIVMILWPKKSTSDADFTVLMWSLYAYFTIYVPKYLFCIIDLIGRIPQMFRHQRIKGFRTAAIIVALFTFAFMWWGSCNRNNIQVKHIDFTDARLPEAFDGYRFVQISDIHTGTFGTDTTFLADVVSTVNALKPDAIFFTGDVVNRHTSELEPFVSVLSKFEAPVYSVLGNHDYGDYYQWDALDDKEQDHKQLLRLQEKMGWKYLNNAYQITFNDTETDSLIFIGVENIGDPPFAVYGDLDAAYPALDDDAFKILLSHNPAHWVNEIADAPDKNIPLTLSGHTHAMQTEIFGLSPAAWRYKTWGGMYGDEGNAHRLYVNIGLGEVGFPARFGATPEITLFTLHRPKQ